MRNKMKSLRVYNIAKEVAYVRRRHEHEKSVKPVYAIVGDSRRPFLKGNRAVRIVAEQSSTVTYTYVIASQVSRKRRGKIERRKEKDDETREGE